MPQQPRKVGYDAYAGTAGVGLPPGMGGAGQAMAYGYQPVRLAFLSNSFCNNSFDFAPFQTGVRLGRSEAAGKAAEHDSDEETTRTVHPLGTC